VIANGDHIYWDMTTAMAKLTFTLFLWRPPQPVAEIDTMQRSRSCLESTRPFLFIASLRGKLRRRLS
jgi:hypothetical protein